MKAAIFSLASCGTVKAANFSPQLKSILGPSQFNVDASAIRHAECSTNEQECEQETGNQSYCNSSLLHMKQKRFRAGNYRITWEISITQTYSDMEFTEYEKPIIIGGIRTADSESYLTPIDARTLFFFYSNEPRTDYRDRIILDFTLATGQPATVYLVARSDIQSSIRNDHHLRHVRFKALTIDRK